MVQICIPVFSAACEHDTGENFSFVEFWAPPPTETIWTVTGDRCTWAPVG